MACPLLRGIPVYASTRGTQSTPWEMRSEYLAKKLYTPSLQLRPCGREERKGREKKRKEKGDKAAPLTDQVACMVNLSLDPDRDHLQPCCPYILLGDVEEQRAGGQLLLFLPHQGTNIHHGFDRPSLDSEARSSTSGNPDIWNIT